MPTLSKDQTNLQLGSLNAGSSTGRTGQLQGPSAGSCGTQTQFAVWASGFLLLLGSSHHWGEGEGAVSIQLQATVVEYP